MTAAALTDLVVLDLSHALAGPFAATMLGDYGAEIIKIEPLDGEISRHWGPPFYGGESAYFVNLTRSIPGVLRGIARGGCFAVGWSGAGVIPVVAGFLARRAGVCRVARFGIARAIRVGGGSLRSGGLRSGRVSCGDITRCRRGRRHRDRRRLGVGGRRVPVE